MVLQAADGAATPGATTPPTTPAPLTVGVVKVSAPGLSEAQQRALDKLLEQELAKHRTPQGQPLALEAAERPEGKPCLERGCLQGVAQSVCGRFALSVELTSFGQATVLQAASLDTQQKAEAGVGAGAGAVAPVVSLDVERLDKEDQLPAAMSALAGRVVERWFPTKPAEEASGPPPGAFEPSVGVAVKIGNALPTFTGKGLVLSGLSPRFDFEADYYATESLLPFLDASLVLGSDTKGNSVQLIPVLVGCKYLFRPGKTFRPFLGMGLGLGFLTSQQSTQETSFAIYGETGVATFPWERVGFTFEASLNLSGVEVSTQSGLLVAFSGNFGVVVLF